MPEDFLDSETDESSVDDAADDDDELEDGTFDGKTHSDPRRETVARPAACPS